ncbi:NAD(P)/FAD-dependent oxidoreductase [Elizabethkingia anophelis]|uniref:NAD(P)/FAD-dependent oxidoreductase n=1 Tax=Elizabethkingia anophelis TaxID=1117645 RepID=UPI00293621BC|nr:pyridine nucleotide-disulfide oxidoreductase [Elizabethkingia anophelis]MDV3470960.1 pyridine nucleotide-disulfide oxidoreductase [Elizabethkingia anophelis]MDV3595636.1 pyridine nucleotide-disulfide oxidoreductase [Elizabethkingia anophelis]MDV3905043.1 pyridine nucleotide-disulfide oxidoreductase [Elizabethkingia anophelis]
MKTDIVFDAIIIGGSYAGLSSAMSLGRSLRNVLIIDDGKPCNRQTPYSHNFLTHDGKTPQEISQMAKVQVKQYPTVQFYEGEAVKGVKTDTGFIITTNSGEEFSSRKLILAAGIKDIMPDIKGFSESWGISVIHCPYCHGYEYRNEKTGIIANGERAVHIASLINNLTKELTILTSGPADFDAEQRAKLERHGIPVIEKKITEIEHQNGHVDNIVFEDGTKMNFKAVYAAIPFLQNCDIAEQLGCELTEKGYIQVDSMQKTNVPGVFACGDSTSMMRSVALAVGSGNLAGAMLNMELVSEIFA